MIMTGGVAGGKFENPLWYLDDLDYNERAADRAIHFFQTKLTHVTGRWAGKPFEILPWQEHRILRPLFGLKRDGKRRIRKGYCEIPKKNGKSELVAGIGCYLFIEDNEALAEVYTAACDREQAGIIHRVAARMLRNNSSLDKKVRVYYPPKKIVRRDDDSVFQALSSDIPTKHGLNAHAVLFDELHAQPNSQLWDILTEGSTVAREQPLIFAITTAGYDRNSICWRQRDYALRVLNGSVDDLSFLPVIYGMDEEDDWENEDNWRAVNPSMDTIFSFDSFKTDFTQAKEMPHKQNLFRRLRLNQWTRQETRYIPMDKWYSAPRRANIDELRGELCYVGLDLATVMDIAALTFLFPPSENRPYWDSLNYFFVPKMAIDVRAKRDRVPYDQWVRDGHLIATTGNTIDYDVIEAKIMEGAGIYKLAKLGYDRAFAIQIIQKLDSEGILTQPVGMGYLSMAAPMKELLRLVMNQQLRHGNNPVMDWMAENLAVKTDPAGNVKPAKDASTEKIDGIVSNCCALFCAIGEPVEGPSYYATHGIEYLMRHAQVVRQVQKEKDEDECERAADDAYEAKAAAVAARYGG